MKKFQALHKIDFNGFIKDRRTALNFDERVDIGREEIEEIIELTRYAPSCFNLQHAKYNVMIDRSKREDVKKFTGDQHKIVTASAVILVSGNPKAYLDAEKTMERHRAHMDEVSFSEWVEDATDLYENKGEYFQRDEAIRNASLSAMMFMLIAKNKGWDTGPISGFDPEEIKRLFKVKDYHIPVIMITIGKQPDQYKNFKQPPRKAVSEILEFISWD